MTKLVARGLERYGAGQLEAALSEWEHALALEPEHVQAGQYVKYVRENFSGLEAAFKAAREAAEAAQRAGVPLGDAPVRSRGDDYAEIEVSRAGDSGVVGLPRPPGVAEEPGLDTGWDLEQVAPLPPPPEAAAGHGGPGPGPETGTFAGPAPATGGDLEGFPLAELGSIPTGARALPPLARRTPAAPMAAATRAPAGAAGAAAQQRAAALTAQPAQAPAPPGRPHRFGTGPDFADSATGESTLYRLRDHDLALLPEEGSGVGPLPGALPMDDGPPEHTGTGERTSTRHFAGGVPARYPGSLEASERDQPSVEIDPGLLPGPPGLELGALGLGELLEVAEGRAALPDDDGVTGVRPGPVAAADELRERAQVEGVISIARQALQQGDTSSALDHAEIALRAAGDGALGAATLQRHKELLSAIFEAFIGPTSQVPAICVPVHQLGAGDLDHRAAFLLSRIDGALTIEEILDIAGMPRFDALRLLAQLVRKGYLEVR
ncbi:MAG: hypothetical protein IT370_16570 [Deltaproteobacteria bacterium]|nr:hypothetical protein [Deltaproteobacteria bacterium]